MRSDLTDFLVLFGAALGVAWVLRFLRAPAIIGFLCAGVLIGPSCLNLIDAGESRERLSFLADVGLLLLLFTAGVELSAEPLLRSGRHLLLATGLQMGLTVIVVSGGLLLATPLSLPVALLLGVAAAPSSTAIVVKQLSDRGETDSTAGVLVSGVSILQDIWVILLLVPLPLLAPGASAAPLPTRLLNVALALTLLVAASAVARLVVPLMVNVIFRHSGQEFLSLFAVVMACLGAWLAELANWSWALGAFIVGLLLAQSDLRHQLRAEITPFREVFNALFFIAIGMLVDLGVVADHALPLAAAVVCTLALKAALAALGIVISGWPLRHAITAGLGLATISEFGYVLAKEATNLSLISPAVLDFVVAWVVGTMLLGALLVPVAEPIAAAVAGRLQRSAGRASRHPAGDLAPPAPGGAAGVIVVGYGINGQNLARVLRATSVPFTVVELNRASAAAARGEGCDVIVGDAARMGILERAGLARARALVVAIAEPFATRRIVAQAHRARPELYILARTRALKDLDALYRLGAAQVIPEEFETSIEIFAHVLKKFAIPDNVIAQQIKMVRAGRYGMLRGAPAGPALHAEWSRLLEGVLTQTFLLEPASPASGRTIRELALRKRTGVTIVALTRAGKPLPSPAPETQLLPGDVLVLVGSHQQLDRAKALLSVAEPAPPE